ncbi:MAG: phosphatidate cytidylyltransferase [Cyanobacteriota bacterium]|nr:phosphatidate cytidylyltransferase [Cyanobacteriota bacterium]
MKLDLGLNKNATRMLTGFILGFVVLLCIMQGGLVLLGMLAFILYFATKEYVKILNYKGFYPSIAVIYATEIVLAIIVQNEAFGLVGATLTICSMCAFMWVLFVGRQPYIANAATTLFGMVYCGWFPLHLIFFRNLSCPEHDSGLGFVVMMLVSVIATDVGCYYAGRHLGKHKLAPTVSPNKTIEGSIGGACCCVFFSIVIGTYLGLSWYMALIAGLITTIFAQIGDLCESLLKRDAGVKDSGHSLPGHGGFLDRTDSFALTIPIMYYFFKYFVYRTEWQTTAWNFVKGLMH